MQMQIILLFRSFPKMIIIFKIVYGHEGVVVR